jgi:NFU1 iron-sulfur cluster scaffold homolog, mitochondrial
MSRTNEEIIQIVHDLIESRIQPAVAGHGGKINFVSYNDGELILELSGACAGCAGSTATLKYGVENMVKHYIPEVLTVEAVHASNSGVDPYYSSNDTTQPIPTKEIK